MGITVNTDGQVRDRENGFEDPTISTCLICSVTLFAKARLYIHFRSCCAVIVDEFTMSFSCHLKQCFYLGTTRNEHPERAWLLTGRSGIRASPSGAFLLFVYGLGFCVKRRARTSRRYNLLSEKKSAHIKKVKRMFCSFISFTKHVCSAILSAQGVNRKGHFSGDNLRW